MNTPHQDLQKAKEELIDLLKHHEAVLAFQEAEKAIGQVPQISHLAGQMKAYQQEAVLFQKIEKQRAYEEAGEQADLIRMSWKICLLFRTTVKKCRMPVT